MISTCKQANCLSFTNHTNLVDFSRLNQKNTSKRGKRCEKVWPRFLNLCAEKTEYATKSKILHFEEHHATGNWIWGGVMFLDFLFSHFLCKFGFFRKDGQGYNLISFHFWTAVFFLFLIQICIVRCFLKMVLKEK